MSTPRAEQAQAVRTPAMRARRMNGWLRGSTIQFTLFLLAERVVGPEVRHSGPENLVRRPRRHDPTVEVVDPLRDLVHRAPAVGHHEAGDPPARSGRGVRGTRLARSSRLPPSARRA